MAMANNDRSGQESGHEGSPVTDFVARLSEEERMLILLREELYEGSWEAMLSDLRNRLEGRPYIIKLATRIHDDISRIEQLRAFEEEHATNLGDYVSPPASDESG